MVGHERLHTRWAQLFPEIREPKMVINGEVLTLAILENKLTLGHTVQQGGLSEAKQQNFNMGCAPFAAGLACVWRQ